tara:strand:- start:808 stop:1515 length:708 start_codon:yes stop_codon:yes gene_type:complete
MKKLIITLAFVALSTVSVKAIDLGAFSLTAGAASNSGVFGASATETNFNDSGALGVGGANGHVGEESGVFQDSYTSSFIELNVGEFISLGYEHTPDSITTPTNVDSEGLAHERSTFVDFNDLNTMYVKVNLPVGGLYLLAGTVETDMDIKISGGTTTYANKSVEGTITAAGFQKSIGESNFGIRAQASYMEFDNVTTTNGAETATVANGGLNSVTADNLAGASAKIALTYTIGRN